jgi:hypothetical protein
MDTLQREAAELGREAKRASTEILEERVDRVFSFLDDVESAVRAAARELDNEKHASLAHYAYRAADEVASARRRFGSADVAEIISSAEELARRRPLATLGVAFAAGFAFVRFLKSTPQTTYERGSQELGEDGEAFDAPLPSVEPSTRERDESYRWHSEPGQR